MDITAKTRSRFFFTFVVVCLFGVAALWKYSKLQDMPQDMAFAKSTGGTVSIMPTWSLQTYTHSPFGILLYQYPPDSDSCFPYSVSNDRCEYVKSHPGCSANDGYLHYTISILCFNLVVYFCASQAGDVGVMIGYILLLFVLFVLLGTVAEEFFAPIMAGFVEAFNLSHNVAGVTFLAFGNGAPDIFASFSALTGGLDSMNLGFNGLLGAAVFVPIVVVGLVSWVSDGEKITRRPYARDCLALLLTVLFVFICLENQMITLTESLLILMGYVVYVAVVVIGRMVYQSNKKKKLERIRRQELEYHDQDTSIVTGPTLNSPFLHADGPHAVEVDLDFFQGEESEANPFATPSNELNEPLIPEKSDLTINSEKQSESENEAEEEEDGGFDLDSMLMDQLMMDAKNEDSDEEDEEDEMWIDKIVNFVLYPFQYIWLITISLQFDQENWDYRLAVANSIFCILWSQLAFQLWIIEIVPHFFLFYITVPLCLLLGLFVYKTTEADQKTMKYSNLFLFLGFLASIAWIYTIANELVALLSAFGTILSISPAVLGFTVLAWGNSLGDVIADLTVARTGSHQMAIGAALGGPVFNILIGVGASMTYNSIKDCCSVALPINVHLELNAVTILIGVVSHLFFIVFNNFELSIKYSFYCFGILFFYHLGLYAAFIGAQLYFTFQVDE